MSKWWICQWCLLFLNILQPSTECYFSLVMDSPYSPTPPMWIMLMALVDTGLCHITSSLLSTTCDLTVLSGFQSQCKCMWDLMLFNVVQLTYTSSEVHAIIMMCSIICLYRKTVMRHWRSWQRYAYVLTAPWLLHLRRLLLLQNMLIYLVLSPITMIEMLIAIMILFVLQHSGYMLDCTHYS